MVNKKTNKIMNGVKVSFYVPREWHEQMKDLAEKNHIAIKKFIDNKQL